MTLVVAVVAAVVAVASYLTWLAGRLDRLAIRVDAARAGLDAAPVRRAAAAGSVARRLGLAELDAAATAAREAGDTGRENVENDLGRALRAVLATPAVTADLVYEVSAASARVQLARQFHNDAVRDLLALRGRPLIRVLHLYGRARPPAYFEIDDLLPALPRIASLRVPAVPPVVDVLPR